MNIKEKIISELETKEGYLPDEAQKVVEKSWWIIEYFLKFYHIGDSL